MSGLTSARAMPPRRPPSRWEEPAARLVLAGWALVALLADFLASSQPILLRTRERLYVLPNLVEPAALAGSSNADWRERLGDGEWALYPLSPHGPYDKTGRPLEPPSGRHWLGTDDVGRDVFARLVHGARLSLGLALATVLLSTLIGVGLGALGGYLGGLFDAALGRVIETLLAIPWLFLLLAVQGMVARVTLLSTVLCIALLRWTSVARLVRAEVLREKNADHVLAARALGLATPRLLVRHILPACLAPVLVAAGIGVAEVLLVETGLTFLGFGLQPPMASWGELLAQAQHNQLRWWLTLFPGASLFVVVAALNRVGEGLRDRLDPRSRATPAAGDRSPASPRRKLDNERLGH